MTVLMGMNETDTAKSMMVTGSIDRVLSRGTHTVFAPGETVIREMDADREQISALTNYMHTANQTMQGFITDSMVMPADMARGKTITMLNGKTLSASSKDGTLMLDGARITRAIQATNGMIYVIDSIPGQ
ncbi:fasciclin domain-containing protein [Methanocella arvoryzae]|nr:fasciclin domain-containing protein [Methanocella arvoryzae]